ncbi:serine protease [Streptomyces cellulosae]
MISIFDLQLWVALAALLAAVISGAQVISREVLVPWRKKLAESATVRVASGEADRVRLSGNAVQIAPKRWVTARHLVTSDSGDALVIKLRLGEAWMPARVAYEEAELDLAVLESDAAWEWTAKAAYDPLEPGCRTLVTGWTTSRRRVGRFADLRATQEYTVLGPVEPTVLSLGGAMPPPGFSGAVVVDADSGKAVAIVSAFSKGDGQGHLPGLDELVAVPLSCIPDEHRHRHN